MSKENDQSLRFTKGVNIMNNKELAKVQKSDKMEFVKEHYVKQGLGYMQVVRAFVDKFGDTERNAKNYIKKVKVALKEEKKENLNYYANQAIIRYNDLYNKLYEQGKYKEAGDVQAKIDKLTGIEAPKRIDVNQNSTQTTIDLTGLPLDILMQIQGYATGNIIEATVVSPEDDEETDDELDGEDEDTE